MSFDPIEAKRTARYTPQELKEFWTGPLHVIQKLFREDRAKYEELHLAGEHAGVLGPSATGTPAPREHRPPTKTYTPEELKLRGDFSEDYCRQLFAGGNSSAAKALFEADPERYQDAKDAAISFNILPPRNTPRPPAPSVVETEYTQRLSDQLADESNLPRGTIVNSEQLEQLCRQKVARDHQAQETAAAKVAADRQAELATLTAKQQAEQAARDLHQADLDRLVELTTPKQTPTAEPIALATARVIAQEKAKSVEVPTDQ